MAPTFSSHGARWQHLNDWLLEHRELWQPTPFTDPAPGWTRCRPELTRQLAGFSDEDCEGFENDPVTMAGTLSHLLPALGDLHKLTVLPSLSASPAAHALALPEVRARDMPGRKRLQSGAFAAAVRPLHAPVVDWCCGKGHLARTLFPICDQAVTGYEWDPALVADGNRLAQKFGDAVTVCSQDVMAEDLRLRYDAHVVALHACGDLHRQLMRRAARQKLPRVSIAPCCFHLSSSPGYQPLSDNSRQWKNALQLKTSDLKLAVEETVTAPARVRNQVQIFSQWRLGFDGLQRALRGVDDYLPVPSHPRWVARGDFRQFCAWAAGKKQLALPQNIDYAAWEDFGVRRLATVRRHELVRHLFRRPLELWLVLDYATFLEERGYQVRLGTFCDRQLTPRNLLIDAALPGKS